jgi:hypothetical protein
LGHTTKERELQAREGGLRRRGRRGRRDLHVLHDEIEIVRVGIIDDLVEIDEVRVLQELHDVDLLQNLIGDGVFLRQRLREK